MLRGRGGWWPSSPAPACWPRSWPGPASPPPISAAGRTRISPADRGHARDLRFNCAISPKEHLLRRPDRPRLCHARLGPSRAPGPDYTPVCGAFAAGADPPCSCSPPWPLRRARHRAPASPGWDISRFAARLLLGALLRDAREQCTNFCLPVPAVAAERTYGSQLPGLGPPRDGLRVNPEHGRYLCWGQQRLGLWRACRHVDGLSSWTGTAILLLFCSWLPLWSLPWMSHMVYSDHIAITSGDKSTTRSKMFICAPPRCSIDPSHAA